MTERIRVHTVGHCTIEIGDRTLTPAADRLFCLALILTAHRGASITREEMGDLLWDEPASSRDPHALRQLIYRLRQMGFPLREDRDGAMMVDVTQWDETASTDFTMARYHAELVSVPAGRFSWLPGYRTATVATSRWIEFERLFRHGQIRRELHAALTAAEAKSHWAMVERYAEHLVALDPCNEDAVEALAVACALLGAKREALRVLDRFRAETESSEEWVSASAMRLRRRVQAIEEATDEVGYPLPVLIGRDQLRGELQQLVRGLSAERAGRLALISGMHGMGKTRLAGEVRMFAQMAGAAVCSLPMPTTSGRSVLEQCIGWLLDAPGVLGASPEMLERLRASQAEGVGGQASGPLRRAITEVLWAIADEAPVVVVIDDVVARDRRALSLLVQAIADVRAPVLGVMLGVPSGIQALAVPSEVPVYPGVLDALSADQSAALLSVWLETLSPHKPLDEEGRGRIVAHAGGTPAFLELWVRHWVATDSVEQVPPTVVSGMEAMRREEGRVASLSDSAIQPTPRTEAVSTTHPARHAKRKTRSPREREEDGSQRAALRPAEPCSKDTERGHDDGPRPSFSRLILVEASRLKALGRHEEGHQVITRALQRIAGPVDQLQLLVASGLSSIDRNDHAAAHEAFSEFTFRADSPAVCDRMIARLWSRILDRKAAQDMLSSMSPVRDNLLSLCQRHDIDRVARLRAAVALIKLQENGITLNGVDHAHELVRTFSPRSTREQLLTLEGRMCFSAFFGRPADTLALARRLFSTCSRLPASSSAAVFAADAGTAADIAGDGALAERYLLFAQSLARESGCARTTLHITHRLSRLKLNRGDLAGAHAFATPTFTREIMSSTDGYFLLFRTFNAMLLFLLGDSSEAKAVAAAGVRAHHLHSWEMSQLTIDTLRAATCSTSERGGIDTLLSMGNRLSQYATRRPLDNCAAILYRSLREHSKDEASSEFVENYLGMRTTSDRSLSKTLDAIVRVR